jgi:hypothetical protein
MTLSAAEEYCLREMAARVGFATKERERNTKERSDSRGNEIIYS